jgi:hypothetical protein
MKKYQLTIIVEVDDCINPSQIGLLDHDVCDGFEVLLNHQNNTEEFHMKSYKLTDLKRLGDVSKEDIQEVAKRLDMLELSESQLNWVILSYEDAQRQDPTATWNLIVEDLLYMLKTNFEG